MSTFAADRPAILNGAPVRPGGPPQWPNDSESVRSVLLRLAQTGDWGRYHGPSAPELIRRLAEYHQATHILPCSSGTAAVELALRGLGVGPGHEVILAGYDFKSNFQNTVCLGAVPVLVDLDPRTWQIDPERIASAITSQTRAILVAHLHGGIVDVPHVRQVADPLSIPVIEDACQNPGAWVYGRRAGTWGDIGILSFGGSKLLTAGRGGALLTQQAEIAERIKRYTFRGNDAYPLSEMQCAVILPQLEQLDTLNERRRNAVRLLSGRLSGVAGLTMLNAPETIDNKDLSRAYYKVAFRYDTEEFGGLSRDIFVKALRAEGIAFDPGFRGLHLIHASRRFRAADELVETTRADAEMLTLYHPVLLEGESAIDEVINAINKVRGSAREISSEFDER